MSDQVDTLRTTPDDIAALFTRGSGAYAFARWGRPIVPVVFGVEEETIAIVKGAIEAVVTLAGHKMAETDPELGANLMVFFLRDWNELSEVPDMDHLIPDLAPLLTRLEAANANQYRIFRFDPDGAIRACFVFLRMDDHIAAVSADALCLSQMTQSILLWSDRAFTACAPLTVEDGQTILRPDIAAVIRAAYDPILPAVANDPSHALRLYARLGSTG